MVSSKHFIFYLFRFYLKKKETTAMDSLLQALQQQQQPLHITDLLLIFLPIISILLLLSRFGRRKLPFPPGPKGMPIIGNMNIMDQLTHRGLAKLANQYGGLLHLHMGNVHTFVVSSPEIARQVLQVQDHIFSNRSATVAIKYLTYDRADLVFAHYGPFWCQMRKLFVMRLFSRKRAESWESIRDEVDSMVKTVAGSTGRAVNVGELVFTMTMDIIYRAAFGCKNEGRDEFIKIMQEFSKLFGAFNIADFFPYLGFVDPKGWKFRARLVKARKSLDKFIDSIIDEHMIKKKISSNNNNKICDDANNNDMVDHLLAFYGEENKVEGSDDLQNSIKLNRNNIKAIIMDVMFGGTETVALVIEWVLAELMKSPEDMKRVQQELADVMGLERRVEESDLDKLTYFKCVLKETLRMHPPIPMLLHETSEDAEVAGYYIPARSRVMINAYAIGRHKDSWKDPDTFRPSRFLEEGMPDYNGSHFEFIPFGSGRRSCPGMALGLYMLDLAMANLLHCFTWELPDGMEPSKLDMSDVFGLTTPRATRLVVVPTKRLACPL